MTHADNQLRGAVETAIRELTQTADTGHPLTPVLAREIARFLRLALISHRELAACAEIAGDNVVPISRHSVKV